MCHLAVGYSCSSIASCLSRYIIHKHINQCAANDANSNFLEEDQTIYLFIDNTSPKAGTFRANILVYTVKCVARVCRSFGIDQRNFQSRQLRKMGNYSTRKDQEKTEPTERLEKSKEIAEQTRNSKMQDFIFTINNVYALISSKVGCDPLYNNKHGTARFVDVGNLRPVQVGGRFPLHHLFRGEHPGVIWRVRNHGT